MIPPFQPSGTLPPGVHVATWQDVVDRYAITPHRVRLLHGLLEALGSLRNAGCPRVYLDGSFVTDKEVPGDFDACWEASHVDPRLLHPELLDFTDQRAAQKRRYGGELFPAEFKADAAGTVFLDFFQQDRVTGEPKGIVAIDLEDLP